MRKKNFEFMNGFNISTLNFIHFSKKYMNKYLKKNHKIEKNINTQQKNC